jgi:hypothetical protein
MTKTREEATKGFPIETPRARIFEAAIICRICRVLLVVSFVEYCPIVPQPQVILTGLPRNCLAAPEIVKSCIFKYIKVLRRG